jgi:hypothetical protein
VLNGYTLTTLNHGYRSKIYSTSIKFLGSQAPRLTGSQAHRLMLPGSHASNPAIHFKLRSLIVKLRQFKYEIAKL